MKKLMVTALCLAMMLSLGASAEVYKWKDSTGKTHYSDWPPTSNVPYTTLSGKKSPGTSANATPESATETAPGGPATPADKPSTEKAPADKDAKVDPQKKALAEKDAELKRLQEQQQAQQKAAKEAACQNAKARVAQFEQGGRIYRVDEKGERQYYGDKEIAEGLAQAKADVAANCTE